MPAHDSSMLEALGGEEGCQQLSRAFYARVGKDPVLRRLFPGKSLRCATNEFGAFLIQFLGGDEEQTQYRWRLSLRESHDRFGISQEERSAWLKHMAATLEEVPLDAKRREALRQFVLQSSAYVIGKEAGEPAEEELAARWGEQRVLDRAIAAIAGGPDAGLSAGLDQEAISLAGRFVSRPSVFVGLLARMVQSGRAELIRFAVDAVERGNTSGARRFAGRTLLHYASGAGCLELVTLLLRLGTDANIKDAGGHTPLYRVANECGSEAGPEIVRALVRAGADVNASAGIMRCTPLHMAARRGHTQIAKALLDCGAAIHAQDRKGEAPLQRAINCRKDAVAQLLRERGAVIS